MSSPWPGRGRSFNFSSSFSSSGISKAYYNEFIGILILYLAILLLISSISSIYSSLYFSWFMVSKTAENGLGFWIKPCEVTVKLGKICKSYGANLISESWMSTLLAPGIGNPISFPYFCVVETNFCRSIYFSRPKNDLARDLFYSLAARGGLEAWERSMNWVLGWTEYVVERALRDWGASIC